MITDNKVLVTGGTGFLGAHVIKRLIREGVKPYIVDINTPNRQQLFEDVSSDDFFYYQIDLREPVKVECLIEQINPDVVFHVGAVIDRSRSFAVVDKLLDVNLKGTTNLLRALSKTDYKSFVFVSTSEVYGDQQPPFREDMPLKPISPYSASKLSAEYFCRVFSEINNKSLCVLRVFNIYGEGQSANMFVPQLIHACLSGKDFEMTKGEQTRDFVYVGDVVEAIVLAAKSSNKTREIINIGSAKEISIKDVAGKIVGMMGYGVKLKIGAKAYRKPEIWRMFCDNTKAKRFLGWQAQTSLDEGLQKTINWEIEKRKGQ